MIARFSRLGCAFVRARVCVFARLRVCGSYDVSHIHAIFNHKGENLLKTDKINLEYSDKARPRPTPAALLCPPRSALAGRVLPSRESHTPH